MKRDTSHSKLGHKNLKKASSLQGKPKAAPVAERAGSHYHSYWLCCFGSCDAPGWAACCISCWFPWFAMGWNLKRVSGNPWLGYFVGLVVLELLAASFLFLNSIWLCDVVCPWTNYQMCDQLLCHDFTTSLAAGGALLGAVLLIGFGSRRYIRKTMEIDSLKYECMGVFLSDFFSWLFAPLGLCQETRTMIINRVENGVWNGPATMIKPLPSKIQNARQVTEQRV